MPLYDFKCHQCGNIIERLVPDLDIKPICCDKPMIRLYSSPAMIKMGAVSPFYKKMFENDRLTMEQERKRLNEKADTNIDYEKKHREGVA